MNDLWKPVPGFEGYHVTQNGKILGPRGKIMRAAKMPSGHLYVQCNSYGRGKQRKLFVHRAVLLAFVGLPAPGEEARHLDGNPPHNNIENLTWGTRLENVQDRRLHGTMPIPHESKSAKLTPTDIPEIFLYHKKGQSSRKIAKQFNVSHTTIQKVVRGERWKGYCNEQSEI